MFKKIVSLFFLLLSTLSLQQCKNTLFYAEKGIVQHYGQYNFLLSDTFYKVETDSVYLKLEMYIYPSVTFSINKKDTFIRLDEKYDYLSDDSLNIADNGYNIFNESKCENIKYTFNYILPAKDYFLDIKERRDQGYSDTNFMYIFIDHCYTIGTYQLDLI